MEILVSMEEIGILVEDYKTNKIKIITGTNVPYKTLHLIKTISKKTLLRTDKCLINTKKIFRKNAIMINFKNNKILIRIVTNNIKSNHQVPNNTLVTMMIREKQVIKRLINIINKTVVSKEVTFNLQNQKKYIVLLIQLIYSLYDYLFSFI